MGATDTGLDLRVRQLTYEADGVVSVRLTAPAREALPAWAPGAHVDLRLPGGLVRQYSLCGSPGDAAGYEVAVLREPAGRGGSRYVHESLRPGERLGVGRPRNTFALEPAPGYLFVAGGIGITPLLPMIEHAERAGAAWRLLYGGRTRRSMAFLDRLARYGDRVQVVPEDVRGRLDLAAALAALPGLGPGALVYGCGPEPLLAALEKCCAPARAGRGRRRQRLRGGHLRVVPGRRARWRTEPPRPRADHPSATRGRHHGGLRLTLPR